jgi:hypothetical protein
VTTTKNERFMRGGRLLRGQTSNVVLHDHPPLGKHAHMRRSGAAVRVRTNADGSFALVLRSAGGAVIEGNGPRLIVELEII